MNAITTRLLVGIFTVLLPVPQTMLHAAEPLLVKTDLFTAGEGGYQLYRIPGIVVTKSGTVLAYCEARKSDAGDEGDAPTGPRPNVTVPASGLSEPERQEGFVSLFNGDHEHVEFRNLRIRELP